MTIKIRYSVRCGSRCNDQPEGDSAHISAYWHVRWALAADKTMEAEKSGSDRNVGAMNPTVNLYSKGWAGKGSGRNEAEPTKEALLKPLLFLPGFFYPGKK